MRDADVGSEAGNAVGPEVELGHPQLGALLLARANMAGGFPSAAQRPVFVIKTKYQLCVTLG